VRRLSFLEEEQLADLHRESSSGELSAAEVALQAGARRLVITHFSARHAEQPHRLEKEAREVFSEVETAEDGMSLEIPLPEAPEVGGT